MRKTFLFLILMLFMVPSSSFAGELIKVFPELESNKKLLLIGGLNFNIERFSSLESSMKLKQVDSYRMPLLYSSVLPGPWKSQNLKEHWQNQASSALEEIRGSCKKNPNETWAVLAYSLGTVVFENVLQGQEELPSCIKSTTYLAPAFKVSSFIEPFLALGDILYSGIRIPSFNLEDYQTKAFTYVGEYEGLRDSIKALKGQKHKKLSLQHALVLSKKDELIDVNYAESFSHDTRKNFDLIEVKNKKDKQIGKYHLIVDDKSLNSSDYKKLLEQVRF